VIAEGVEDREQLDFLTAAGCEEGQGYFFDRPMTADQLATLLAAPSIAQCTADGAASQPIRRVC
jgi:EAL domain-containing protein (putative c-di-GMP-specific phosphodiesterase class I)